MAIKKATMILMLSCMIMFFCSCGDIISVSNEETEIRETISVDTEQHIVDYSYTSAEDSLVNLPYYADYQFCAGSIDEFVDCILAGARDKFASEGVKIGDNEIFITNDYLRYANFLDGLPEVTSTNYHETFFCCTDEGIKLVSGTFEIKRKDDQILIIDSQYISISELINQAQNGEFENQDARWLDDFRLYFLEQSFDKIGSIQNSSEAAKLDSVMKNAGLKGDMPIISLLYTKGDWADYATPASAVDKMLPELKAYSKETFFSSLKYGFVFVSLGNDLELFINTRVMGKAPDGTSLYGIYNGGYYNEELEESKKKLYGATADDLENAMDVTYTNYFNGDIDSDYFFIAGIEGKEAKLFGLTDYEGFIIKDGEKVYPANLFVDNNPPDYFVKADFDKDGSDEYGFNTCVGRGTGCWVEALVIVDPGETEMVKVFDIDDLVIYNGDLLSHVKSNVNEENKSISYWLDADGDMKFEGTTYLTDYFTDTYKPVRYGLGDFLYITYSEGGWHFRASGGIIWKEKVNDAGKEFWHERVQPDYSWPINLNGDIQYKNGKLSYTNLELIPGIEYH